MNKKEKQVMIEHYQQELKFYEYLQEIDSADIPTQKAVVEGLEKMMRKLLPYFEVVDAKNKALIPSEYGQEHFQTIHKWLKHIEGREIPFEWTYEGLGFVYSDYDYLKSDTGYNGFFASIERAENYLRRKEENLVY
jgi:hypothetical protein